MSRGSCHALLLIVLGQLLLVLVLLELVVVLLELLLVLRLLLGVCVGVGGAGLCGGRRGLGRAEGFHETLEHGAKGAHGIRAACLILPRIGI